MVNSSTKHHELSLKLHAGNERKKLRKVLGSLLILNMDYT